MFAAAALEALDFPRVRAALASRAATDLGRERCLALEPSTDVFSIATDLDRTEDATFGVRLQLGGITDIRHQHARAREGRVLAGSELLTVGASLEAVATLRRGVLSGSRGPLAELAEEIADHSEISSRYGRALQASGELRDEASPLLRDLRRRIEPLRGRIRDKLQATLESWADVLQEHIVTLRRDRYVLPVQAARVGQVQGIVVDASATGQTYFVEPAAVTTLNNELARLRLDEEAEERRILAELSALLAADEGISHTLEVVGELDLVAAKAQLARDWHLSRPEFALEGDYELQAARHPLVENAVANDISLGETRVMLITGPNMGGKTVTLKTLGLAVIMHQCGMFVAAAKARLPLVEDILVDIGDEQSIEASLSTFASHLKHLEDILRRASPRSLVLIDELGSGTDPQEGAALAQAIVERLLAQDARGVITSHLAPLKLFALETPGLSNASMGFDIERLSPTYRLNVGQPGRSYALAIARRMGLPPAVLSRAEELLGPEGNFLERLLTELESDRLSVQRHREAIEQERMDLAKATAEAEALVADLKSREDELMNAAAARAEALYKTASENVRRLRKRAEDLAERPKVLKELGELRQVAQKSRPAPPPPPKDPLRLGSEVKVPAYGSSGQVLEIRGDQLVVQLGLMKVSVRRRDVRLVQPEGVSRNDRAKAAGRRDWVGTQARSRFNRELNLRGMGAEEAAQALREAVTEAAGLGESELRVVHGKGQGVLRRLLRDELKKDRRVASYSDAPANEGGHGVTLVKIKR